MKHQCEFPSVGIKPRNVGPLVKVTKDARPREIIDTIITSVLSRDDVLHVKFLWRKCNIRKQAVFAATSGSSSDFLAHEPRSRRPSLRQKKTSFGLKDRQQTSHLNIGLVFRMFLSGQQAFIRSRCQMLPSLGNWIIDSQSKDRFGIRFIQHTPQSFRHLRNELL